VIEEIKNSARDYCEKSARIIADHLTAAVLILGDERGFVPSNLGQGYVLRRLIRGAVRHGERMEMKEGFCCRIAEKIIEIRGGDYKILKERKGFILNEIKKEEERFRSGLSKGLREFNKITGKEVSGEEAFLLFSSFGFPIEMTMELAKEKKMKVDVGGFEREFRKHQETSRTGAEKKFKSGLADNSEETKKLHTATHLLHSALRKVLGDGLKQKGSNITPERLRFDFNFERKMSEKEIKEVENLINKWIKERIAVTREEMSVEEAKKSGATGLFEGKYGERVSVYDIKGISREICTGPHVKNTKELGKFRILKEESSSAGVRRIKAVLG
jgi:alanyl-tRNA synthetase